MHQSPMIAKSQALTPSQAAAKDSSSTENDSDVQLAYQASDVGLVSPNNENTGLDSKSTQSNLPITNQCVTPVDESACLGNSAITSVVKEKTDDGATENIEKVFSPLKPAQISDLTTEASREETRSCISNDQVHASSTVCECVTV